MAAAWINSGQIWTLLAIGYEFEPKFWSISVTELVLLNCYDLDIGVSDAELKPKF